MIGVNKSLNLLTLFVIFCAQFHTFQGELVRLPHSSLVTKKTASKNTLRKILSSQTIFQRIVGLRCGSNVLSSTEKINEMKEIPPTENCAIVISTSVGSVFLDKKKKLSIPRNSTVADLKQLVQKKFPGCPPVALQKLFFGVRALSDNEIIGNITVTSITPILLDMLTGTSVYNKTLSISQALEAHAALIVQQAYLGAKMLESYTDNSQHNEMNSSSSLEEVPMQMESGLYRDMFEAVNRTLYETYAEDIAVALEKETEPETLTDDTAAWRGKRTETKPLTAALAREFDLNLRGIRSFLYYSVLLGIFAFYGTTSLAASQFLLLLVPFLWLSKLRQLRLVFKVLQYLVLPVVPHIEFLIPLLPAPQQVIAFESAKWPTGEPGSSKSDPILPQSKRGRGLDRVINMLMEAVNRMLVAGDEKEEENDGESDNENYNDNENENENENEEVEDEDEGGDDEYI